MYKWFTRIKTVQELRQRYRELLKKYHPDNGGGSVEITQRPCLFCITHIISFPFLGKKKDAHF